MPENRIGGARLLIGVPALVLAVITFFAASTLSATVASASGAMDPETYPALSKEQVGHVRHLVNLAYQKDGDWSLMGDTPPGDDFDAYQFQIAFAAYALAVAHYHYTPAHRDFYRDSSARLIHKMTYKDVWDYWAQMSKFEYVSGDDGVERAYTEDDWFGWIDPNAKKNIMYSGHLLQMVGLHEALCNDRRYDDPGSLLFRFASVSYGGSPTEIKYDHERLAKTIYDQYLEDDFRGIECEPNAVYTECQQHPILGLMHYDQKHSTKLAPLVQKEFGKTIKKRQYISPITKTTMYFLDVQRDKVIPATYAWSDGWTGHALHVWDKALVEEIYPEQRKLYFPSMLEGEPGEDMGWGASFNFGWFALLASEVGDRETVEKMLEYADQHFGPTWKDGGYYYPHTSDYRTNYARDESGFLANISPVTGNVLVGFASINPKDGLWKIYNRPWDEAHFSEPFIGEVDFRKANVSRARFDARRNLLVVTLTPGPAQEPEQEGALEASFSVHQLDPRTDYQFSKDGKVLGSVNLRDRTTVPGSVWQSDDSLKVMTSLEAPHSFVLEALPALAAGPE